MKRLFSLIVILSAAAIAAMAQLTAAEAFINAPTSRFPLIQKMKRMDMVDYKNSGVDKPSDNLLGGKSKILSLTPEKIVVEVCEGGLSVTSISVDKSNRGDTVLIVTADVATPAPDGAVSFFTSDWKPLAGDIFNAPVTADWIKPQFKKQIREIENLLPFVLASYSYDPLDHTLTLTPSVKQYLPESDYDKVKEMLSDKLVYRWNGKKMVQLK